MRWSPGRPLTATAASRLLSAAKTASSTKRTSARRNSARSYIRLGSCSGSRATGCCPRIGRVHCNFHLCAVHARLGGPRRLGKGPAILDVLVGGLIIVSMLLFSRLMQHLGDLQIGNVLHLLGDQGRAVIGEMFRRLDDAAAPHPAKSAASTARLGRVAQTVKDFGKPRTIAKLDVDSLVALAREGRGTILMACAVGDTLVEGSSLLHVHDSGAPLPQDALRRAVHLKRERTFEQDQSIRSGFLSTSPSRRCRRRSTARRQRSRPSINSRTSCAVSARRNWTPATPSMRTALCGWCSRRRPGRTISASRSMRSGTSARNRFK